MLPEVIAVTVLIAVETSNLLSRHANLLIPDIECLIVICIY